VHHRKGKKRKRNGAVEHSYKHHGPPVLAQQGPMTLEQQQW
jgi:hypothetical protein